VQRYDIFHAIIAASQNHRTSKGNKSRHTRIRNDSGANGRWRGKKGSKRIFHKTYSSNAVCDAAVSGGSSVILWPCLLCMWVGARGWVHAYAHLRVKGHTLESTFTVVAFGRVRSFAV